MLVLLKAVYNSECTTAKHEMTHDNWCMHANTLQCKNVHTHGIPVQNQHGNEQIRTVIQPIATWTCMSRALGVAGGCAHLCTRGKQSPAWFRAMSVRQCTNWPFIPWAFVTAWSSMNEGSILPSYACFTQIARVSEQGFQTCHSILVTSSGTKEAKWLVAQFFRVIRMVLTEKGLPPIWGFLKIHNISKS